ncbi:expansin EXLX1 family cellulose-binding protein [Micromonospora sp. WMMD712]|uniref:expansin EXLX1 family cellulose-binding protein n=1 Tax=Micromonospora sp. WMMD712 TaxID=3016096 RepID=UPI00249C3605|nr:expansin EXLX1 family cellulose-binding protein [Micromonospora sp. WMMD712]WFE60345.1 expansin EXLX1 family cellulose-binding protein [Micromonospora sp. WMMD712]
MTDASAPPDAPQPAGGPGRRRAPGPGRSRWLAAGGVAVLAGVLGLTLALRAGATPACAAPLGVVAPFGVAVPAAAPPVGGTVHKGKATFYDSKGAGGNCSYPSAPANRLYVALGPSEYAAGAACGGHLDVTGPKGTVRVLVMDQCPECAPGHLDLSREAFARIADPVQGVVSVSYRAVVDPPLPGPLAFRIKEGASRYWFAVLVADHGNPLRAVEVRQGDSGGWRAADRQDYNYWLVESGVGPGPFSIRVTDVHGHRVTAGGVRLTPGQVQRGTVRMYGGATAGGGRPATRSASPRPSASPSPRASSPRPSPSAAPASAGPSAPVAPVVPLAAEAPAAGCRN